LRIKYVLATSVCCTGNLGCEITGEETIKGLLRNLGLTEKEAAVYIFLSKRGVLKCGEIAKGMKRHTAQIYRILKILQTKGLLQSTLEAPTRFIAVPFETVLELGIKAKRDEAAQMEKTRQEILTYWKSIRQAGLGPPLGKFVVIEGNHKIYPKISQMIKDTKNQLSAVATVSGLARADQFGIFDDIFTHPLRSKIQFRFLTDLSCQNLGAMKTVLKRIPETGFNLRGRIPDIGLQSPRMVIRDEEEILFFITPKPVEPATEQDVCLWTDCKELVHSFSAVFEDFWRNSTDIEQKIAEIERSTSQGIFVSSAEEAEKTYREILSSPKRQMIMLTSSQWLTALCERTALIETWIKRGVSVKIMAPITSENLNAALRLSECCQVRHVPSGYLQTTIVDEKHLFHFDTPSREPERPAAPPQFRYTSDRARVKRIGLMLNNLWEGASSLSAVPVDTFSSPRPEIGDPKSVAAFAAGMKLFQTDIWEKAEKVRGTVGNVLIIPPNRLSIPEMRMSAFHYDKDSLFGEGNSLYVYLRLKTSKGYDWTPVACLETNETAVVPTKALLMGTPAANNFIFVKPDELKVRKQDNTLFVGWTVRIPLPPAAHVMPPACILLEAYGQPRHVLKSSPIGDFISMYESDNYDAFVTFLDPSWKYSAPGTQGTVCTNVVGAMINPKRNST
jgi:sugar-specific transcriptional regulator TrmB